MTNDPNPILSSTAVWHGRRLVQDAVNDLHLRGHDNLRHALDAYAAAILAEVKRRVEGMQGQEASAYNPGVMLDAVHGSFVLRAAVQRVLDGGEA